MKKIYIREKDTQIVINNDEMFVPDNMRSAVLELKTKTNDYNNYDFIITTGYYHVVETITRTVLATFDTKDKATKYINENEEADKREDCYKYGFYAIFPEKFAEVIDADEYMKKLEIAEIIVTSPIWDGLDDAYDLCDHCTLQELRDIYGQLDNKENEFYERF